MNSISKDKILIVIQGASTHVQEQKKAWNGFNILFSTWKGEENKYRPDDNVIFNNEPINPGPCNFEYQIKSTLHGLIKEKTKYPYALKIRSDLVPTNAEKFIKCLDADKFNFLCWHEHEVFPNCKGYLVDYLCAGLTEEMIKLWSINVLFCKTPEIMLTWSYIEKFYPRDVFYFLDLLSSDNDLLWIKNNLLLSSYKASRTYDKYKIFTFSNNKDSLNKNYLNFLDA